MQDSTAFRPIATARLVVSPEPCDLCGGPVTEIKCKIVCRNCGYTRDCSDP